MRVAGGLDDLKVPPDRRRTSRSATGVQVEPCPRPHRGTGSNDLDTCKHRPHHSRGAGRPTPVKQSGPRQVRLGSAEPGARARAPPVVLRLPEHVNRSAQVKKAGAELTRSNYRFCREADVPSTLSVRYEPLYISSSLIVRPSPRSTAEIENWRPGN
jgi:hypothetical protein